MDSKSGNTALLRTAAAFCHPVTIAAVAVMLLNDHLFKAWWPGWWTGKLSDAAWVTFAPLFIALAASLLLPRRLKRRDSLVLWFSLSVTAVSYFLFNSWDPFHGLVNAFFSSTAGWGPVEKDTTDSITLAALALTWWLWWRPVSPSVLRTRALVVGSVAVLATVATAPTLADWGITGLAQDGTRLIAAIETSYGNQNLPYYSSTDGGLSWAPVQHTDLVVSLGARNAERSIISAGNIQYRFVTGLSVERSEDGGITWHKDYDLTSVSHLARRMYYEENVPSRLPNQSDRLVARPGPFRALIDKGSGNLVLAMGQDGVLVRTPQGQWIWANVGPYRLEPIGALNLLEVVYGELLAAVILVVLAFATLLRSLESGGKWSILWLVLAWLSWVFAVSRFTAGTEQFFVHVNIFYAFLAWPTLLVASLVIGFILEPAREFALKLLLLLAVLAFLILIGPGLLPILFILYVGSVIALGWIMYGREPQLLLRIIFAMIVELVLFASPFVLWSQGLMPDYGSAVLLAVVLGVIGTGAAVSYLTWYRRRTLPNAQEDTAESTSGRQNPPVLP